MKRIIAVAIALVFAGTAAAHEGHEMTGAKAVTKSVRGEVVDMGCYLGHAAKGADHVSCATKCLAQGMPMGILTSNGTLYLVTLDHDNADPYNDLKGMAGKQVTVSAERSRRSGMKDITATHVLASK